MLHSSQYDPVYTTTNIQHTININTVLIKMIALNYTVIALDICVHDWIFCTAYCILIWLCVAGA